MKDNEFYRPAESGIRAQELPAARDEFARREAAPAPPKGNQKKRGRLLQLFCGAAAVAMIAQAALPAEGAPQRERLYFPNLLRWEEVTLVGIPFDQVMPEDVESFYPGGWTSEHIQETSQIDHEYHVDDLLFRYLLRVNGEEGHWHRYYTYQKEDGSGPDPEFRELAMGMDVDEVIRRVGISEEEWALLQKSPDGYWWGSGNSEAPVGPVDANWFLTTNGVDRYADSFSIGIEYGTDQKRVSLKFRDGRLVNIVLSSYGYHGGSLPTGIGERTTPTPEPTPEPEETASGYGLDFPNLLRWEEVILAGVQFDQVMPEDLERAYPGGNIIGRAEGQTAQETTRQYVNGYNRFILDLNAYGEEGRWDRTFLTLFDDGSGPDPEFCGLTMGMDVDEAIRCIGISEEEWALLEEIDNGILWTIGYNRDVEDYGWNIRASGADRYADEFTLDISYYNTESRFLGNTQFIFKNGRLAGYYLTSHN